MMKKKVVLTVGILLLTNIFLTGCCFRHDWQEADCTTPKTCEKCGKEEGEALGHTWQAATCTAPKTCAECGETEGEALGHTWTEATCTEAKTCSVCGGTEGEALGHSWQEATCTASKTCGRCGETEGEALGHSWQEATCTAPKTCSICGETEGEALGHELNAVDICNRCGEYMGEGIAYTFEDGVLTVFGKGELTEETWKKALEKFGTVSSHDCHTLIITGDITGVGDKWSSAPFGIQNSYYTKEYGLANDSLQKIIIEDSVTGSIEKYAFACRYNLTEVYVGEGIRSIKMCAFANSNQKITSFSVPSNCILETYSNGIGGIFGTAWNVTITYRQ